MKIKKIKTFIVGNPPPCFGGRYWIFIKLITDKDIVGYGEVYSIPFHPNVVSNMIEDVFERYVKNKDPFKIEKLWRTIYSSGYTQRPDISLMGIISGIEMACWDIIGKDLNKPIYELLLSFFETLGRDKWLTNFIFWELSFYKSIGYDIDFKNYVKNVNL